MKVTSAAGLALLWLKTAFSQAVDSDMEWNLVAPSSSALPSVSPPAAFNRSANIVSPVGTADVLSEARPALLHTNKFYSNFVIDGPSRSAWTLPYLVTVNDEYPFGMYVSHPKFFEGQSATDGRLKWYATSSNKDLILTAKELYGNQDASLSDFDDEGLSATVIFTSDDEPHGNMTTYLVRGMAYATLKYQNYTPEVSSVHAMLTVNGESISEGNHNSSNGRFEVGLNDGSVWILYSSDVDLEFVYVSAMPNEPNKLRANGTMDGTLRATYVPYSSDNILYDQAVETLDAHAGSYPVKAEVSAWINSTDNNKGKYSLDWVTEGDTSVDLLHYALPHHQDLLPSEIMTGLFLGSPTKGEMQLVKGSNWTMAEDNLPDFEWVPSPDAITSAIEMEWIEFYLEQEIVKPLKNVAGSSVYFGAKNLMAYAQICLVATNIGRGDLVEQCVDQVEAGFDQYLDGTNGNPLVYDTTWGGVIGALGLEEENEGADFYASMYNDHHFHYSYLLNAAAVLAYLRPSWATADNKNWVDTIIRDVNDPNKDDPYFPQFRSFDWFCGHSWARGLLFSYDGKDQESTSEDVNFFYAMTMWAVATGNKQMEGLGRLQTGVVSRSINSYFLLKDSNTNHPVDFVRNKVTGIFFESKVDYTTWFGDNAEYIHGIQNIPVTAITESVRAPEFVREEWDQRLASIVEGASGVWATVLYMSFATVQKHVAFKQMLTTGVDDGLLRTWALYWAATRPDCVLYCNHDEEYLEPAPTPTPAPVVMTGPFLDPPAVIPGTVEAEDYDYGGEGVAYHDTDPGNNGGTFRTSDGVDIKATESGGHYVGWIQAGEFLRYTVDVQADVDAFNFDFSVAAPSGSSGSFRVVSGGSGCSDYDVDLSGLVTVAPTGGWATFSTTSVSAGGSGGLTAGSHILWLCIVSSGFNMDSFTMTDASATSPTPTPTVASESELETPEQAPTFPSASVGDGGGPYSGDPAVIPGVIEAEEFDLGGEGVAYFDTDAGNNGGVFRTEEDVDIKETASGGHYVGWLREGESIRYTVNVETAADAFDFEFVVAAPSDSSGSFRVVSGGSGCSDYETDLSGLVMVAPTGGWGIFTALQTSGGGTGGLTEGPNTLWLCVVSSGFNIDSFDMTVGAA